jgi:hypothetical protein
VGLDSQLGRRHLASVVTTYYAGARARTRSAARLKPGWPLTWLFLPFPLWWLIGISHLIFFVAAIAMLVELLRRRPMVVPFGFGFWLLFMFVTAAGVALLWVQPPGTQAPHSIGKLVPYTYHSAWLLAITVVAVYIVNLREDEMSSDQIMRLIGWMFVYTTIGGLLGSFFAHVDFPSLVELFVHFKKGGFLNTMVHPALARSSDFLGYEQPRPTAPFAYPNSWGNNLALFLPFFIASWMRKGTGWRRPFGFVLVAVSIIPIAYSLNRGLWVGLGFSILFIAIRQALNGQTRVLFATVSLVVIGGIVFVASPLYDTVVLRVNTPHSNGRRETVASDVVNKTLEMSPLLGYGESRAVTGSFDSIAGGETPDCHQCAAPPLGTQGFLWRLIFTTGILGTAFFFAFLVVQLGRFGRDPDPVMIVGTLVVLLSILLSFFYDELEAALFTMMLAIGLMNRKHVRPDEIAPSPTASLSTSTTGAES